MNAPSLFDGETAELPFLFAEVADYHGREIFAQLMQAHIRAVSVHGHDAASDDALPLHFLAVKAGQYLRIASERAEGPAQRRVLPAARKKAIEAIIITIGFIAAIDRELIREQGEKH